MGRYCKQKGFFIPPAELWITALSDLEILKFDSERNPPGKENKKSAGIKYRLLELYNQRKSKSNNQASLR